MLQFNLLTKTFLQAKQSKYFIKLFQTIVLEKRPRPESTLVTESCVTVTSETSSDPVREDFHGTFVLESDEQVLPMSTVNKCKLRDHSNNHSELQYLICYNIDLFSQTYWLNQLHP